MGILLRAKETNGRLCRNERFLGMKPCTCERLILEYILDRQDPRGSGGDAGLGSRREQQLTLYTVVIVTSPGMHGVLIYTSKGSREPFHQ